MSGTLVGAAEFSIPRIATARLLLREMRRSDFDAYAENMADPRATEHLTAATDRRQAWRMFASATGQWIVAGAGWWGVELTGSGALIGTVGAFFREDSFELEIGWTLYPKFWRQGFATEAARAALDCSLARLGRTRAIAHVAHANVASIAVATRLGMHLEGDVDFYGERIGRYAVGRAD